MVEWSFRIRTDAVRADKTGAIFTSVPQSRVARAELDVRLQLVQLEFIRRLFASPRSGGR